MEVTTMKKEDYLWIYPSKNLEDFSNKWVFYGTQQEYVKWLEEMPVISVKKILKGSAKFLKTN
jgi:hypothetical protein